MKYLIFFLIVIVLFSFNNTNKERYFFVGYYSSESVGGIWMTTNDGNFIDYKGSIDRIKKYLKLKTETHISVTSIYEFRTKCDYDKFISTYK